MVVAMTMTATAEHFGYLESTEAATAALRAVAVAVVVLWVAVSIATAVINRVTEKRHGKHAEGDLGDRARAAGLWHDSGFWVNSRGMRLFWQAMKPADRPPKALVFWLLGYCDHTNFLMYDYFERLAKAGYAVHALEYEGHGRSDGLHAYIPSFPTLVEDTVSWMSEVQTRDEYAGLRNFMIGESMGGCVALDVHRRQRESGQGKPWDGAVLLAPMCAVSDKFAPHPIMVKVLRAIEPFIPTWPIVPTADVTDSSVKSKECREVVRSNPIRYSFHPRMSTAEQLYTATVELSNHIPDVRMPFLVLHGADDTTTDPQVSHKLYELAASTDKSIILYDGGWHCLLFGDDEDQCEARWNDILTWLDQRT